MSARLKNPRRVQLRLCPFDSGEAELHTTGTPAHLPFSVRCKVCHARTTQFRVLGLAVRAWQSRSVDLGGIVAALRELVASARAVCRFNARLNKARSAEVGVPRAVVRKLGEEAAAIIALVDEARS